MSKDLKLKIKQRSFNIIASTINTLWKLVAVGIIFFAIIIASARLFSSQFSRFKPEVENFLSEQLQRPVTIKSLTLEWPAKGPRILLKGLKISSDESQTLNSLLIANGDVSFNLWESIFYLDWITEGLNFQGIQAIVNPEIQTTKNTPPTKPDKNDKTQLQAGLLNQWLLRQSTIEIYDSYLLVTSKKQKKLSYALPVLTYHGGENKRQLSAHAITSSGAELQIKSESIRTNSDSNKIVDVYISGQKINLEELPESILGGKLAQFSGLIDVEIWSQWKQGLLDNIFANIATQKVSNIESKDRFSLLPFKLVFKRSTAAAWTFATSDVIIKVNQKMLQPFKLIGANNKIPETGEEKWNFSGLNIPISMIGSLSKSYLPGKLQQWLSEAKPSGKINNLTASIVFPKNITKENSADFELAFDLNKFSSNHWGKYPGFSNLTASIRINQQGIKAALNSKLGELELSPTFRYPLHFDQLTGTIKLLNTNQGSELLWDDFFFNSEEIQVKSSGIIEFPEQGEGYLEIVALLKNGDTSLTPWFLPVSVMSSNLVNYLDKSVNEGKLTTAKAIARGPFSSFPYDNLEGVFDIRANIEDVNFNFQPDWAAIKGLSAELRFFGDSMFIDANKGNLSGVEINRATASIGKLSDPNAKLIIEAKANSQDQSAMNLLSNSPLKVIADSLNILKFGGEMETSLKMEIPMKGKKHPDIDGTVKFNKSSILLKSPKIPFQQITGYLNFDKRGLTTSKLKGKLWEKEFSLDLLGKTGKTQTEYFGDFNSELSTLGINSLAGINSELLVSGSTPLKGKLKLITTPKSNKSEMTLDFTSKLQGVALDIPGIIKKNKTDKYPAYVNLKIKDKKVHIKSEINNEFQLIAESSDNQWRGAFSFSKEQQQILELPTKPIWASSIYTDKIELIEWLNLLKDLPAKNLSQDYNTQNPLFHFEINANQFSAAGFNFESTKIILDQDSFLKASVKAKDIDAEILYTYQPNVPISINFNKLNLFSEKSIENFDKNNVQAESSQKKNQQFSLSQFENIQPSDFPRIKINCKNCSYNKQNLGTIELETIPADKNLGIVGKWYQNDLFENNFTGVWNKIGTEISGKLTSKDLEAFSNFWELSSGIKKSSLSTNFALSWKGAPWEFSPQSLQGKISSDLTQGHIEEVNTKGAQLFSFLSLQNLKRRLTLDFNDVFEEGFFYDKIAASFIIKNGLAYSDPVKINGTAADIEITGYADLINEEFNQHMVVTPKLSSSLPVLAGWAISPTTALVALVLDKILIKPALDVVTRIDYKISGPWEEPKIIEVGKQQKEFQIEENAEEKKQLEKNL